jgi:hypothetical protein
MIQQLADHMGFDKRDDLDIKYDMGSRAQRNADGGVLLPRYTYQPRELTRKPLQSNSAGAGAPSQMNEQTPDAPKRKKRNTKRKVRHALAAERVPAEAPKMTTIAPKLVTGEPPEKKKMKKRKRAHAPIVNGAGRPDPVEPPEKKKMKKRKRAHAPIANGAGGPDPVEAPKKKKGKKSGVGGPNARSIATSMWTQLSDRDAEKQRIKRETAAIGKKTKGKGKTTALKRPAAAPKASKIRTLGCSKCRYLKNGCSACR